VSLAEGFFGKSEDISDQIKDGQGLQQIKRK
jgi:hypothetical protein